MKLPVDRDQIYTTNNGLKVLCLIKELCKPTDTPIFTLRDEKEGYESLRTLFVSLTVEDPSEATFASVVFDDVGYWLKARENKILKPYVEEWREEADVKRKALAFNAIVHEVKTGGKSAFSAAKFLIEEPYKDKRTPKTKAQVQKTTEKAKASVFIPDNLDDFLNQGKVN
jgi:hypothetical protein